MMPKKEFKQEWCQMLIDHMGQGQSFESFGRVAKCGKTKLYEFLNEYPEFKEAKSQGELESMFYWEKIGIAIAIGSKTKDFDSKRASGRMVEFFMRTRFHKIYGNREKHEIETNGSTPSFTIIPYKEESKDLDEDD